ncbi:hypothetical protein [Psychromicrobium sp. YIM B11713]|uniref:phosphatase domain-containing protein n=1 Tax=Psychromicrobium sp. YIM B11713 TaxID=3145233 RepID=UPI00374EBE18
MTDTLTELKEGVIVDVDGTLCDVSGIRHYLLNDPKRRNFEKFHKASALCPPIPDTLNWVHEHLAAGKVVFVVTARKRRWEYLTRQWLRKWEISYDFLLMRADADDRRDDLVKADILAAIRAAGFIVTAAIDDNPGVIALWEAEGIPVTVVPGWSEPDTETATDTSTKKKIF